MALNSLGLGFLVTAKDAASAVFNAVGDAMGGTEEKAKKLKETMGDIAGAASSLGLKMVGFGAAGLAGLGVATHAASDYNAAIAEVASITDRANFPIETMKAMTMEMASTYGGDLTTHVKALYQAASSGAQNAAQAQQLLTAANLLAVGGLSDSFQAVDALTNITNAFGMSLDTTTDIADAMFVAVKVGKTDITQLAGSIGDLAPMAKLAGVNMADMFSAVAAASNQLGSGTKAITGIRAALSAVLSPTAEAAKEADKLGINFSRAHLEAVGFPAFLKEITDSSGYTVDSLSKLFGSVEAIGAVAALTANGGKSLNDAVDAMAHRAGAAEKAFKTMADAAAFAEKRLKANLQIALVKLGEVLLPVVESIMRAANEMLIAFNNAPDILRQVVVWTLLAASGAALLVGGLLLLAGAIAGLVAAGEVVLWVAGVASGAFLLFVAAAALAGLAVAGFRAAVEQNVGGIGDYFKESFGQVKLAYDALTQLFTDGYFSGAVDEAFSGDKNKGVEQFATQVFLIFHRLKAFAEGISEGFQTAVGAMGPIFAELVNSLKGLGEAFGLVQDSPKEAGEMFERFGAIGKTVGEGVAGAFKLLVKVFMAVVDVARGVVEGFKFMGPVFSFIGASVASLITSFASIGSAFGEIGGETASSTSVFEKFGNAVGAVAAVVGVAVGMIVNAIATAFNVLSANLTGVIGALSAFVSFYRAIFDVIAGILTGDWDRAWQGAKMVVYSFASSAVSILSGMLASIGAIVDSIGAAFGKDLGIRKAVEGGAKNALKDLAGAMGVATATAAPKEVKQLTVGPGAGVAAPGVAAPAVAGAAAAGASTGTAAAALAAPGGAALGGLFGAAAPITLNSTVKLEVDGASLAQVLVKQTRADTARAYGPTPTAT